MSTLPSAPRVWYGDTVNGPRLLVDSDIPAIAWGNDPIPSDAVELKADRYNPGFSWHDCGLDVIALWKRYTNAKTQLDAASVLVELNNSMSDLASWLPGYDPETGEVNDPRDAE